MAIYDKITNATQNVIRGTKDFTDTARLNSLIAEEQKQITSIYEQIGRLYFFSNPTCQDTPIGQLCASIVAANKRNDEYNEEIQKIKGIKHCPACGSAIKGESLFCSICGAKYESDKPQPSVCVCSACKAEIPEGTLFCPSCGYKQSK